ncbi:MAG: hypothetical protein EOM37_08670 [Proteobacteria bacterium]|jgi:type IV pilus biogenesis protein CpaD/CtpE|nr:CpaD family pilus assembly lipoprotein [Alphaproteobacteria bacterium]NCC04100.1 hypothetical protein [Pseudomonadota bacterium]
MSHSFISPLRVLSLVLLLGALTACEETRVNPDYRIKVMPSADNRSYVAIPPQCADWTTVKNGAHDNVTSPQYGCAQARNLAAMVEQPHDLIEGKPMGKADGALAATSVRAYQAGKTKALIDVHAEAPSADMSSGAAANQSQ